MHWCTVRSLHVPPPQRCSFRRRRGRRRRSLWSSLTWRTYVDRKCPLTSTVWPSCPRHLIFAIWQDFFLLCSHQLTSAQSSPAVSFAHSAELGTCLPCVCFSLISTLIPCQSVECDRTGKRRDLFCLAQPSHSHALA